jgi:hypothetical protein
VPARDGERVVAVADLAEVIDGDQPVTVAVEGEADVGARRAQLAHQVLREERAAARVDVRAVGGGPDRHHARAEAAEDAGGHA